VALTNLAEVYFLRGDLDEAQRTQEQVLAKSLELGQEREVFYAESQLARIHLARGRWERARQMIENGLASQISEEEAEVTAGLRFESARLKLWEWQEKNDTEGKSQIFVDIQDSARRAAEVLHESNPRKAQEAESLRVRILVLQGHLEEAREVFLTLEAGEGGTSNLATLIAQGWILGAQGQSVASILEAIDRRAAEVAESGWVLDSLEARLAAGEMAAEAGLHQEAKRRLEALRIEAGETGLGGYVRRARAIARAL
jgi:hypothetical protein